MDANTDVQFFPAADDEFEQISSFLHPPPPTYIRAHTVYTIIGYLTWYDIELCPDTTLTTDILILGKTPFIHAVHNFIDLNFFQIPQEIVTLDSFKNITSNPAHIYISIIVM